MENQEKAVTADEHLIRWANSGLSQKEYCKQNSVNPNTFAYWRHRSKEEKSSRPPQNLIRIETKPVMAERRLEIRLNLGILRLDYVRVYS